MYRINYRQKEKRRHAKNNSRYSNLISPQGKTIRLHPKIIDGRLISHTSTKITPDMYRIKYRQKEKRRHAKNNSRYSKLISPQGKIIPLHTKIIDDSLISYT